MSQSDILKRKNTFKEVKIRMNSGWLTVSLNNMPLLSNNHELLESDAPLKKLLSFILAAIEGAYFSTNFLTKLPKKID